MRFGIMLGLLESEQDAQGNQPPGGHAIIDDRRGLEEASLRRCPRRCRGGGVALPREAAPACGLVLEGPLLTAIQGAAREPLAFPILDIANRLTAGGASSSVPGCGASSRGARGSLADRRREGKKSFCCVTTRRRNLWVLNSLGRGLWPAGGARVRPGRAGLWRRRPGDVWPAAVPPASGGPAAGIPDPGSSAGSSAAAGTCGRTLCAGRSAGAVGALWRNERCFGLTWRAPMGGSSPKGKARGECANVLPERDQNANETLARQSKAIPAEQDKEQNGF